MTKKKTETGAEHSKASSKKTYCKEEGCFEGPQLKGFCRTHFLKAAKSKQLKADDDFEEVRAAAKNRRKSNRLESFGASPNLDDEQLTRESERLSELDLDIEEMDVESILKKTG
jgi:hypothetical protein